MDRDTRQPRGFAFVEMTDAVEARDAIRILNGSVHGGRALIVNEARPKLYRGGDAVACSRDWNEDGQFRMFGD